ncbi:uncharacterized protein LOC144169297 [Haemaphysalis longicornis]
METSTPASSTSPYDMADEASGTDADSGCAQLLGPSVPSPLSCTIIADDGHGVQREPGPSDGDSSAEREDEDECGDEDAEYDRPQEWLMDRQTVLPHFINLQDDSQPVLWTSFNRRSMPSGPEITREE